MRELRQNLRFALRAIRNNPGFTSAVVLTLALGIGANTAIFSVVHAVLLQPIPYPAKNPGDVVVLAETPPRGGRMGVSYPTFVDWLEQVQSFEQMAGYRNYGYNLTGRNEPISARVLLTSASYFDSYGVQPLLGRFYTSLAMILSAVGIYGVIAYSVAQRMRELGLRIALGAQRAQIFRLVVQQGMVYAVAGLLLGVGGAFAATRWMESLLFGVVPTDPQMFVSVPLVLAGVAFLATALPALRATAADPLSVLRAD